MDLTSCLIIFVLVIKVASLELGQTCTSNLQCNITNSSCLSGVCACISDTIDDNGATTIGGSCRSESDFTPQNIHVDEIGVNHLKISWTDPVLVSHVSYFVATHTVVLTGYTVSQNVTKTYTTASTGCNMNRQVFSVLINGLNEATNYRINIKSVFSIGGIFEAEIFQFTKPSKPNNVTSTNIAPTVIISWTDNTLASVTYSVVVKSNNSFIANVTSATKSQSVSGLQSGETYYISVYAVVAEVYSEPASMVLVTVAKPPDPPKELRYDRRSSTQIILHWLEPENQYGTVDYYYIHVDLKKVLTGTVIKTTFQADSWTFNGINTTKDYCFMVYSHNIGGFNSTYPSTVCLIDSEAPVITSCPKQITVYADKASSSTSVTWSIPTATDNSRKPVKITQTAGQQPSSNFRIGVHYVSYQAEDEVGNIETNCFFYVIVKAIVCETPLFKDKYIKYICPSGYQYGFSCILSCIGGFEIVGPRSVVCDSSDESSPVNNTVWNFQPKSEKPSCNATEAPFFTRCPDTIKSNVTEGLNGVAVSWQQPRATDYSNREVIIEQIMGKQSGSIFTTGVHEVKYRASSQFLTKSAECSFFVFVTKETLTGGNNCQSVDGYIAGLCVVSVVLLITIIILVWKLRRVIMEMKEQNKSKPYSKNTNFANMDTFDCSLGQDPGETRRKSIVNTRSNVMQPQHNLHNDDSQNDSYLQPFNRNINIPSDGSSHLHPQTSYPNESNTEARRQITADNRSQLNPCHRLPGDGEARNDESGYLIPDPPHTPINKVGDNRDSSQHYQTISELTN